MKIAGIIVAALMLTLSALVGILGASKSFDLGGSVEEITQGLSDQQIEAMGDAVPSSTRLKLGGAIGVIGALAAVGLLVIAFIKKPLVTKAALIAVGLCLLAIIIYPHVEAGPTDGMAPRTQSIVAMVMAIIGAGGALLAQRRSQA